MDPIVRNLCITPKNEEVSIFSIPSFPTKQSLVECKLIIVVVVCSSGY